MIEKGCGRVESQTRMSCRVYVCSWLAATVCVRSAAVLVHNNCSKSTNACIEQHKHMNPRKYDWQLLIKVHCTATQPDDCKTRGHTWFDVCTYKHVMSACRSTGVYVMYVCLWSTFLCGLLCSCGMNAATSSGPCLLGQSRPPVSHIHTITSV